MFLRAAGFKGRREDSHLPASPVLISLWLGGAMADLGTGKGNSGSLKMWNSGLINFQLVCIPPLIKTGFSIAGSVESRLQDLLRNRIF